ncbi:MAG: DNA-binding protein [Elusimicrobiota bacterium]
MKLTGDYKEYLLNRLKDESYAIGYLNECLKDGDESVFLLALRNVAEAQGGLKKLAAKANLNREHLFRMLSKNGNPYWKNVRELAHVFGWRLEFVPESAHKKRKAA